MPLDLLYVITDLEIGGVPLHLQRLATAMRDRGRSVAVVSLKTEGPVGRRLLESGIPVHSCGGRGGWDFRVIGKLARIVREQQPRLIHSLLFHANLAARRAARQAGFPADRLVCEIQTVEVERPWHLWVDRRTHRGCRLTIGNSPSVIEHLARHAHIPRERLRLVRGGIDVNRIRGAAAIDRSSSLPDDAAAAPLILWVGRLDPVKGLDFLIEAFRSITGQTDAHLALVGGGPLHDQIASRIAKSGVPARWRFKRGEIVWELTSQIARSGLQGRVHLLGPRNDVPGLLGACDLFVFPSRTEGLPNALLEAMAAGKPIVATDVPGNRDLIAHERTGLLVPFGNVSALSNALLRLLADDELSRRLGAAAAREVVENWSLAAMVSAYEKVYDEALSGG